MSDPIKHECGIAFIRLLKPLSYYKEKYGETLWGLSRMQMLMAKQLNRGQDGAGIGVIKLEPPFGQRYIARKRSNSKNAVADMFENIYSRFNQLTHEQQNNPEWLKNNFPYAGELMLGHLRYGTHGGNSLENLHPFLRQNNWMSRNLVLAGNYNLTNVDELINTLIDLGQQPKEISDNVTLLEKIGHFLDEENEIIFRKYKEEGVNNKEISSLIKKELNIANILKRSFKDLDGGYNLAGMIGNGDAFIIRDPNGIRPSFYFANDEFICCASERSAICTVFNIHTNEVKEIPPGNALIIKANTTWILEKILDQGNISSCSFERIYFSKGNDRDIYKERKKLGKLLTPKIIESLQNDLDNAVFAYVPNTAATSFYGLIEGVNEWLNNWRLEQILNNKDNINQEFLQNLFKTNIKREKVLIKDAKIRTFITNDQDRSTVVGSAYDITYDSVHQNDALVIVDDSIVRGTTLRKSILKILERLNPRKIIVVSSCPQIRYPDCYGIDMSKMNDFIAFRAVLSLIKEHNLSHKLQEIYQDCKSENLKPSHLIENKVKKLYDLFDEDTITRKIAEITKPAGFKPELEIVFQSIDSLNIACPNHTGNWYFTGNYPTPGGNKVANRAFCFFFEGNSNRAY